MTKLFPAERDLDAPLGSAVCLKSRIDRYFASFSFARRAIWVDLASWVPRGLGLRDAPCPRVARAYIGTSGWVYAGWREHLYGGTPTKRWLQVASRAFDALEINGSFYTQIKPETYERWYAETPPDFKFALKGHRFVTHYKRLGDCHESITRLRDQC